MEFLTILTKASKCPANHAAFGGLKIQEMFFPSKAEGDFVEVLFGSDEIQSIVRVDLPTGVPYLA